MPAHAIHFRDSGAALEERFVDRLLVGESDAIGWERKKRGAAAGDETKHKIVGSETFDQRKNALGRFLPGGIRNRMARFHHLDALTGHSMPIACHDQAFERALPMILDRLGHSAAGFARSNGNGAALRPGRKMWRQTLG